MREINLREKWLRQVARKNSGSKNTNDMYNYNIDEYLKYIDSSLEEIAEEWDNARESGSLRDRERFYEKHLDLIDSYIMDLEEKKYATSVIIQRVATIMSFYHSLPNCNMRFDFKSIKPKIQYHNRDITKEEIVEVLKIVSPRERAFYTMMCQGGFSPITLTKLRYKHLKEDFEAGRIPCKVDVPQDIIKASHSPHFTFIGRESIEYLKQYFKYTNREQLEDDDLIFLPARRDRRGITRHGEYSDPKSYGIIFSRAVRKLKLLPENQYVERKGKPKQLRLYCLRKFFRKYAGLAGVDFVNYWMGHKLNYREELLIPIPDSDKHYFSKDPEHHRQVYERYAMPNLQLHEEVSSETVRRELGKIDFSKLFKSWILTEEGKRALAQVFKETVPQELYPILIKQLQQQTEGAIPVTNIQTS